MKKEEKKETKGRDNQYSPCFCEGVAGPKAGDAFTQTRLMSAFWVSTGLHAPHEGLLEVERRRFRGLGV